jgi:hypothetical protein
MRSLFAALGIDYDHWKALTIAALKIDLRMSVFGRVHGDDTSAGLVRFLLQLLLYVLMGAFVAMSLRMVNDLFLAAVIVITYVVFMVGMAILLDHNAAVTSPTDYAVLGFQPLTSRTWFAARLANVLVYTLAMTTAVGILPALVFFFKYGPAVGGAGVLAILASAITVTLVVITIYAWMMQLVGAQRLRSLLSWVQLLAGFVVYGGYFLVSRTLNESILTSISLDKTRWMLLYPGTWFASYLELAAGRHSAMEMLPALASVALLGILAVGLRGRLSLDYAEQLGRMAAATQPAAKSRAPSSRARFWFREGEARAMAILVRAQFKNDLRFRMGVLAVLPMTIVYLFAGVASPRQTASRTAGNLSFVTMAVLLFPAMLKMNLTRSDAFRASWIFFASPADRTRLIRSSKNVLVAFFLVPYLLFVGVTLTLFRYDVQLVALYVLLAGLFSHLVLLMVSFLEPELPFSKPAQKGRTSAAFFAILLVLGVLAGTLTLLLRFLQGNGVAIAITLASTIALSALLDRLTRARVERRSASLEFEG